MTEPAEPDPHTVALSRAVERTGRKVADLDKHVRQLAADLLRVTEALTRPGPADDPSDAPAGPPAVRTWLLASDPDQAVADLADLIEWLDRVYLRYHLAALSSCWLWHPDIVEELWWLRRAHADAYHPEDGSWLRVGDWHDRQRPAVVARIRVAIGSCELALHAPGEQHARSPAVAPLAAHAAQVAAAWTTGSRPEPSPAQIAEAEAHSDAQHRSSYR